MVAFGEEAGGDVRALSLIHATRVLIVVTVALLLAAAAAGVLPASRAARIDPNAALRVE